MFKSLQQSILLDKLKIAKVIPVFKCREKSYVNNYQIANSIFQTLPGSHLCKFLHKGQKFIHSLTFCKKKLHKCDQRHKKKHKLLCIT